MICAFFFNLFFKFNNLFNLIHFIESNLAISSAIQQKFVWNQTFSVLIMWKQPFGFQIWFLDVCFIVISLIKSFLQMAAMAVFLLIISETRNSVADWRNCRSKFEESWYKIHKETNLLLICCSFPAFKSGFLQ